MDTYFSNNKINTILTVRYDMDENYVKFNILKGNHYIL